MRRARGTFWMRAGILLLAVLFGVLVYWSVGFLLDDIKVFKMPDREAFFESHLDHSLSQRLDVLEMQLRDLDNKHELLTQQRGFIKDSSSSLQVIVDNLFKLKNRDQELIRTDQFAQVLAALDKIIAIQDSYKTTADEYLETTNAKHEIQKEIAAIKKRIERNRNAVNKMYSDRVRRQQIKSTIFRMLFLLPLVLISTLVFVKKRGSIYRMIYVSSALAIYIKTAMVIHERFPSRYFKYILTVCLLCVVGWGFGWVIRRLVRPKLDTLLKQYRQSYERFLCPVCEYPIRRGPRKHLYWTRRTVNKTALISDVSACDEDDKPYACPACGTQIFEVCESCGDLRHSLLPNCEKCGAVKSLSGEQF